jgi:lysophospholipase L1-like esterase
VPHADLGKGNGKDVIMIGDSWMSNTLQLEGTNGGISTSLTTLSKQPYRNYAVQGVMMLTSSLFGAAIPTQWDDALRANPDIKTVIMTAGGNDIIQNATLSDSCAAGTDACAKKLEEIRVALANLWAKMSAKGVADIVHVTYSSAAGNVKYFDKNVEDIKATCAAVPGPARCHVVETTAIVSKSDLAVDGIHPVKAANDRIAKAILDRMAQEGVRR